MAEAFEFPGFNRIFEMEKLHPEDDASPMEPMPAFQGTVLTYSCWRPSAEEMEEIIRTGEVWVAARCGLRPMQPHWVGSLSYIKFATAGMGNMWNPQKVPPPSFDSGSDLEPA